MAVAKGQQSVDSVVRTPYIGVGAVKVLAVNPSKAEMEKLYDRQIDNEPSYLGEVEVDGKKLPNVRVTFVVKTDAEKNNGIEVVTNHTFFLQKKYRQGSQSGKYQIIDKYGRTAWATKEEIEAKQIPAYANGPANIDADYRPCYVGEEELTTFIKNLLNIPNVQSYVNGQWVPNPKVTPQDCEVRLDNIAKYFEGDFKELREIISYQPENLVKVPFGVRTSDDNRQFQTTYTQMCFKNSVSDYARFDKEIQDRKAAGALATTEFEAAPLHVYEVDPTTLNPSLSEAAEAAIAGEAAPW